MTAHHGDGELADPWIILEADSGDVVVYGMCAPKGGAKNLPKKGESVLGARAVIEVLHKAQSPTESPTCEWRVWIAWRGHVRTVNLDAFSVCVRCGRVILDVGVSPEGLVLVEH
jgi:hypothetical protein